MREKMPINKISHGCILLLVFIFLFSSSLSAADLNFKGMAGWSHSTTYSYLVPRDSLSFGAAAEFWISDNFGLETGALFVRKGHDALPDSYTDSDGSVREISFPLLLKAGLFLDKKNTLFASLYGGVDFSVILDEMDPNFPQNDLGIMFGADAVKWFENIGIFLDMRFDLGTRFLSIEYLPGRTEFRTFTLFVMAGIKIRKKSYRVSVTGIKK
jgi:hypothetical protein